MAVRLPRPSDALTPSAIHSAPFGNARFVLNKCEDWHDHCYWVAWWPSLSERSAILRGRQLYTREYEARIDLAVTPFILIPPMPPLSRIDIPATTSRAGDRAADS